MWKTAENESGFKKTPVSFSNNVIIDHLNINSIRNQFEMLQFLLGGYIDILIISESKLDGTFTSSQLQIYGFRTPYRLDRNNRGGGSLLFEIENLIIRLLSRHFSLMRLKYYWKS